MNIFGGYRVKVKFNVKRYFQVLGKKIITTNEAVRNYDFYTKDQILVLEDKYYTKDELLIIKRFIEHDYNEDS